MRHEGGHKGDRPFCSTDVRTLREGLALQDEIEKSIHCFEDGNVLDIMVSLRVDDQIARNYWLMVEGVNVVGYIGDFIIFDMGAASLFVLREPKTSTHYLRIQGTIKHSARIVTKTGTQHSKVYREEGEGF